MASTVNIQGDEAQYVRKKELNFNTNEYPNYPKGLKELPSDYYIYLPKEDLHPISDMQAAIARASEPVKPHEYDTTPAYEHCPISDQEQVLAGWPDVERTQPEEPVEMEHLDITEMDKVLARLEELKNSKKNVTVTLVLEQVTEPTDEPVTEESEVSVKEEEHGEDTPV